MKPPVAPRVFLSYASEDEYWIRFFKDELGPALGNVRLEDYATDNLDFGPLGKWIDAKTRDASVVVAFVSENYRKKKWSLTEWNKGLDEVQRRRLIFVPIMLDADAKEWWRALKSERKLQPLQGESGDYQYSDFTDRTGNRLEFRPGDSSVVARVVKLGNFIRNALIPSAIPPAEADVLVARHAPLSVVLLGHPTARHADEVAQAAEQLVDALRARSIPLIRWQDGWRGNPKARSDATCTSDGPHIFVQPVSGIEAGDQAASPKQIEQWLDGAGVAAAQTVVWLPQDQRNESFEAAAREISDAFPVQRTDAPTALVDWLHSMLKGAGAGSNRLVLQMETIGAEAGTLPNIEATQLIQRIKSEFCGIVGRVITPEPTVWEFFAKLFDEQIVMLPGSRAIIAVHDLDTTPTADPRAAQRAIELKFHAMQEAVSSATKSLQNRPLLDVFWTALLVRNAKHLPFALYPHDGRFRTWRLLRFERIAGDDVAVVPDPASLAVFRAQLHAWANAGGRAN